MRVGWDGVGRRWGSVDCELKMNVLGKKMMKSIGFKNCVN